MCRKQEHFQCMSTKQRLTYHLTCPITWKEVVSEAGAGLFSQVTVIGWEVMALTCTRRGAGWISERISSEKEWWGTGTCCPGRWWSHHPWRYSRSMEIWHWGTWLVGMMGMSWWLDWMILEVFSNRNESVILWYCDTHYSIAFFTCPLLFTPNQHFFPIFTYQSWIQPAFLTFQT